MLKMPRDISTWPRPPQVAQVLILEPRFRAGAVAGLALVELGDGNFLFAAERGLFERDFQIVTQIVAALRARRILAAAEDVFKNAAAARAEDLAENVERIVEAAARRSRRRAGALARVKRGVAVLVVGGAFLRVAQRLVGLAEFLEFFLGLLVARIFVRMKFHGQLAVGFLDFLGVGFAARRREFRNNRVWPSDEISVARLTILQSPNLAAAGFLATITVAGRSRRSRNL